MSELTLYFDGRCTSFGALGALSAYGWAICRGDEVVATGKGVAARGAGATPNAGEYVGLITGLQALLDQVDVTAVEVRGDSEVVIRQMTGVYCCYAPNLLPLYRQAQTLAQHLLAAGCAVTFRWVPRQENKLADGLSRQASLEARSGMGDYAGSGDLLAAPLAARDG